MNSDGTDFDPTSAFFLHVGSAAHRRNYLVSTRAFAFDECSQAAHHPTALERLRQFDWKEAWEREQMLHQECAQIESAVGRQHVIQKSDGNSCGSARMHAHHSYRRAHTELHATGCEL
jgi:hypothetical protein